MTTTARDEPSAEAPKIAGLSRFLDDWCSAHSERVRALAEAGHLGERDIDPLAAAPEPDARANFQAALRAYRYESLAVIAWRDLAGIDALEATLAELSALAERCIEAALGDAERRIAERYGVLRDADGARMRLIVIGMGKLGGGELNFSSDIDLIFAYRNAGCSDGARELDAESYCKRLARTLVQTLNESTEDGFVYRVDTRLRPFGDAGALVASIGAMEAYYQNHGREWERYAWVKARPVAGDLDGGRTLIERLRPFVYRRYLDYGTFESIRDMKALIDRQVAQSEMQDNIKLGPGGIREIEFIGQAFQLIRGGPEPALRDHRLRHTLARLAEAEHLPSDQVETLDAAYCFLRRVENRLQMADDRQTHDLPADAEARRRLARALGYDEWPPLASELERTRGRVQTIFRSVFEPSQPDAGASKRREALTALWEESLDEAAADRVLADLGVRDARAVRAALTDLKDQGLYRALGDRGRRWIARLVPMLIEAAAEHADSDHAITRTLTVVTAIIGRSTYIALLVEHPDALAVLVRLCAASAWITARVAAQPALLDSLLDPRQLFDPPDRYALSADLTADLAAIDADDLEHRMEALRRFKQSAVLRIAAADISRSMPLMSVSDRLTDLAEVVLGAALDIAWYHTARRHGAPPATPHSRVPFAVIAYGKLGGLELGYTSDLDLVFVYDGATEAATDGERPLTAQAFFTRLAQRLIHILNIQTGAGRVYEIDMRLRPSGQSGLMVTHIDALERYQHQRAWTWEHQALVRARPVAGDTALGERFIDLRRDILMRAREPRALAADVRAMRERMRRAKDEGNAYQLDVKQMPGGLIDIEFLAQFAALAHGHAYAEIVRFTDAIRILESLESAGIASLEATRALTDAYREYRRLIHAQSLQQQRAMISADRYPEHREAVVALWRDWIETVAEDIPAADDIPD